MPPEPPRPPPPAAATVRALDFSVNVYRESIARDAADLGIATPAPEELAQVFPYDVAEPAVELRAGGGLETRDLALSLRVGHPAGAPNQNHLILRIENKTDAHVAYRVHTRVAVDPHDCLEKVDMAHNALALRPHEAIERTECTTRRGAVTTVRVERVESIVLPALSYFYVSRLFPPHLGLDARATRGHVAPKGPICTDIPEQIIRRGMEKGEVAYRDVVDFYARESCAQFIFPLGYRAFRQPGERRLPVPAKMP